MAALQSLLVIDNMNLSSLNSELIKCGGP